VEVCRRLDGIPLAIELAAARVHVLAPEEIAARLGDRFRLLAGGSRTASARHQTLRTATDWSYDLLTEPERRVFERLAVFAGDFSLDAAEAVCTTDVIDAAAVLDLITRLVDRSLVVAEPRQGDEPTCYQLLETLRLYALERLLEHGEVDDARACQAAWMDRCAEQLLLAVHGPDQGCWLRWAEREHDNARTVLAWALEQNQAELAARVAAALSWSWLVHLRWSEGLEWVHKILALPDAAPTRERGMLLMCAIQLALFRGDLASNRPSGALATLRGWLEECFALAVRFADDELQLATHGMIGVIREFGVELDGLPHMSIDEMQCLVRRSGSTFGECRTLEVMARNALRAGDLTAAAGHLNEAARVARAAGDTLSLALVLNQCGDVERARGAHSRARALYEESLALFADVGLDAQPNLVHNLGYLALAAGNEAEAAARFTQALKLFRRLGEERGVAECLIGFGCAAAAEGRAADAATLFGAAEAALEGLGTHLWPANGPDYERWQARARGSLGADAFTQAVAAGRLLSPGEAASLALEQGAQQPGVSAHLRGKSFPLTPREREVAQLVARGLTNRQIAGTLVISEKTAANHLQHVLEKLDLRTRTQLAARAAEFGLAPVGGTHPRA
jgi:DNA-binding CsgD family transcriptional regulator